jgi:hypothetical protein
VQITRYNDYYFTNLSGYGNPVHVTQLIKQWRLIHSLTKPVDQGIERRNIKRGENVNADHDVRRALIVGVKPRSE